MCESLCKGSPLVTRRAGAVSECSSCEFNMFDATNSIWIPELSLPFEAIPPIVVKCALESSRMSRPSVPHHSSSALDSALSDSYAMCVPRSRIRAIECANTPPGDPDARPLVPSWWRRGDGLDSTLRRLRCFSRICCSSELVDMGAGRSFDSVCASPATRYLAPTQTTGSLCLAYLHMPQRHT
jgi:hypothetical protein